MLSKKHQADWLVLLTVGILLMFLYRFSLMELLKRVLEWTFVAIGYKLLIEYGILGKLNSNLKNEQIH